jgi:hypothetical protein
VATAAFVSIWRYNQSQSNEQYAIQFEIPIFIGTKLEDVSLEEYRDVIKAISGKPPEGKGLAGVVDGFNFGFGPKPRFGDSGDLTVSCCVRIRTTVTTPEFSNTQQRLQKIAKDLSKGHPEFRSEAPTFEATLLE